MNIDILKQVIIDQQPILFSPSFISRLSPAMQALQNNPQIIVIMGIRRCGKSTLLQEIRQHSSQQNYYINFDDDRLVNFTLSDFQHLLEIFIEFYGEQKIFFFDEIQNIPGWERFVRRLHDQGNKIYLTGSNATLFSKELGTRLTGRYIPITLYPFSFKEYVSWCKPELLLTTEFNTTQIGTIKRVFSDFLNVGGFPEFLQYQQPQYLHSLYESIIYRDILARYGVKEKAIKELSYYLASHPGKEFSYNGLKKNLGLASATTVSDYCGYLENSFLFFFISRYDYSLKKQLHYAKKSYCIDPALAKTIGFYTSEGRGRLLENIVFTELKRRGKEVYFHQDQKECDFVIKEGTKITAAIQVTTHLSSAELKERELSGLASAVEKYALTEGLILTEHEQTEEKIAINGKTVSVRIAPIWRWLLQT